MKTGVRINFDLFLTFLCNGKYESYLASAALPVVLWDDENEVPVYFFRHVHLINSDYGNVLHEAASQRYYITFLRILSTTPTGIKEMVLAQEKEGNTPLMILTYFLNHVPNKTGMECLNKLLEIMSDSLTPDEFIMEINRIPPHYYQENLEVVTRLIQYKDKVVTIKKTIEGGMFQMSCVPLHSPLDEAFQRLSLKTFKDDAKENHKEQNTYPLTAQPATVVFTPRYSASASSSSAYRVSQPSSDTPPKSKVADVVKTANFQRTVGFQITSK